MIIAYLCTMKLSIPTHLQQLGIKELNTMQQSFINAWDNNNNLMLLSPTGSGKTLAFLLPLAQQLQHDNTQVQALILSPARELSLQIESVFKQIKTGLKVNCCYGGHSMQIEQNNLQEAPAVLIGTPGRIADHIRRENFNTSNIQFLILDEFDKALELGFQNEMREVVNSLPKSVRIVLTSATDSIAIPDFIPTNKWDKINFLEQHKISELKTHKVTAEGNDKLDLLVQLICNVGDKSSLIFCNHREAVERIANLLNEQDICCDIFHGGMQQLERERALIKLRNGSIKLLVTTDLASRGLDIPEVNNVIHYQLPKTEPAYTHRNGRTARMHANGDAFVVLSATEKIPDFIDADLPEFTLKENCEAPQLPQWESIYVGMGKKEKINKIDLVGFFFKKGKLKKEELGVVTVLDHASFVAVKRGMATKLIQRLKNERVKNKKIRMQLSK